MTIKETSKRHMTYRELNNDIYEMEQTYDLSDRCQKAIKSISFAYEQAYNGQNEAVAPLLELAKEYLNSAIDSESINV